MLGAPSRTLRAELAVMTLRAAEVHGRVVAATLGVHLGFTFERLRALRVRHAYIIRCGPRTTAWDAPSLPSYP